MVEGPRVLILEALPKTSLEIQEIAACHLIPEIRGIENHQEMIGEVHQETQEINQGILEGLLQISDLVVVAQGTHVVNVVHQALHLMDDFQGLPILHSSNGHLTKGDLLQEGHQVLILPNQGLFHRVLMSQHRIKKRPPLSCRC